MAMIEVAFREKAMAVALSTVGLGNFLSGFSRVLVMIGKIARSKNYL
jgi:hypothetical protein